VPMELTSLGRAYLAVASQSHPKSAAANCSPNLEHAAARDVALFSETSRRP
jgi:hypothetical protein